MSRSQTDDTDPLDTRDSLDTGPLESKDQTTLLLRAWRAGDDDALDQLMPRVFDELRRIARGFLDRERRGHTLQPTALVNEAYLRLVDASGVDWQCRAHFLGVAAQLMRRVLVDDARRHRSAKRGGDAQRTTVDFDQLATRRDVDLIALDEALSDFEKIDATGSRIVELKFFAGLTRDEIAEVLEVSPSTIQRKWQAAKSWLFRELRRGQSV